MQLEPGYYVYLGARSVRVAFAPASSTIRSGPNIPTDTLTTCDYVPPFTVFGLLMMCGGASISGPMRYRP